MKKTLSDQDLVSAAKKGNRRAFDLLVLKYQQRILSAIRHYVSDVGEVFDIAQETFIKAFVALPHFREESSFYTWTYQIAINTAKNYLARSSHKLSNISLESISLEPDNAHRLIEYNTPENSLLSEETANLLAKSISELPEDLKITISLRELVGLSYADIAKVMHSPIGTVRSRLSRAREIITKKLEEGI